MKQIIEELKEIERDNKIRVIYAVEAGSKAWGIESKDSDYDVRFIFVRPKDDYLALDKKPDVIDINKHLPVRDYVGFDIYKFLHMIRNSNPSIIEWLFSNIIYVDNWKDVSVVRDEVKNNFNPKALFHHYKSMCKQNYLKYLKSGNLVTYKKYLYAMRGLINAKWVQQHSTVPYVEFSKTINEINPVVKQAHFPNVAEVKEIIPIWVLKKVCDIIYLKKEGKEGEIIQNIVHMDEYIESFLKSIDEPDSKKKFDIRVFNNVLRNVLEE